MFLRRYKSFKYMLTNLKILITIIKKFSWYSGITYIIRKFYTSNKPTPPNGVLWFIGIYLAAYGVASQRYENNLDQLENRIFSVMDLIGTDNEKQAIASLTKLRDEETFIKPEILNPVKTFKSLFGYKSSNSYFEKEVDETIRYFLPDLTNLTLYNINFIDLNLDNVNFSNSTLVGCDFSFSSLINANFRAQK